MALYREPCNYTPACGRISTRSDVTQKTRVTPSPSCAQRTSLNFSPYFVCVLHNKKVRFYCFNYTFSRYIIIRLHYITRADKVITANGSICAPFICFNYSFTEDH